MQTCPTCASGMKPLFDSYYCPNDCDRKKSLRVGMKIRFTEKHLKDEGVIVGLRPFKADNGKSYTSIYLKTEHWATRTNCGQSVMSHGADLVTSDANSYEIIE